MAVQVHRRQPQAWAGAVLVAPMCKVRVREQTHGSSTLDPSNHWAAVRELSCALPGAGSQGRLCLRMSPAVLLCVAAFVSQIAEEMMPPPALVAVLKVLAKLFPTWKLVPTKDITEVGFKDPEKRERVRNNPVGYFGKPRLNTALQLLLTTEEIGRHLHEVLCSTVLLCEMLSAQSAGLYSCIACSAFGMRGFLCVDCCWKEIDTGVCCTVT